MATSQSLRFLNNEDSSAIAYKTFNQTPLDRYPTYSICLHARYDGPGLLGVFDNYLRKFGVEPEKVDATAYNKFLKGADMVTNDKGTEIPLSQISQIDYEQCTIKLETFLYAFALQTKELSPTAFNNSYKEERNSFPFYISHADPDTICFTRKSQAELGRIRTLD